MMRGRIGWILLHAPLLLLAARARAGVRGPRRLERLHKAAGVRDARELTSRGAHHIPPPHRRSKHTHRTTPPTHLKPLQFNTQQNL